MRKHTVKEDAAGGSVGAGAIAVAPSRMGGGMRKRQSLKQYLTGYYSNIKNRLQLKTVNMSPIKEYYDLGDVVSKLKGVERANSKKQDNVIYGVEDDDGNIMKITVKKEQAKDFEYRLAHDMAEAKEDNLSGKEKVSLAELLYNLKDEFDIVDVDFPKIPKDMIYNADKATKGPDTAQVPEDDNISDTDDQNGGMDMGGDMGDGSGDLNAAGSNDPNASMDGGEGDLSSDMGQEGEEGDEGDLDSDQTNDFEPDDDSVEDFEDESEAATPESILQSVMDMLKADAEAKKAQADAAAEESRAKQAEYSYRLSQATVDHEEEVARMEMDMDSQKQKEKQAKKMADLAKYRVQKSKTSSLGESSNSILKQVIMEIDQFETNQTIRKAMDAVRKQYAPNPQDTPDMVRYKRNMISMSMKELTDRLQQVKLRDQFAASQKRQQTNVQTQAQNQEMSDLKNNQNI